MTLQDEATDDTTTWHNDGDGRHNDDKGQQDDGQHNDNDRQYDDAARRRRRVT